MQRNISDETDISAQTTSPYDPPSSLIAHWETTRVGTVTHGSGPEFFDVTYRTHYLGYSQATNQEIGQATAVGEYTSQPEISLGDMDPQHAVQPERRPNVHSNRHGLRRMARAPRQSPSSRSPYGHLNQEQQGEAERSPRASETLPQLSANLSAPFSEDILHLHGMGGSGSPYAEITQTSAHLFTGHEGGNLPAPPPPYTQFPQREWERTEAARSAPNDGSPPQLSANLSAPFSEDIPHFHGMGGSGSPYAEITQTPAHLLTGHEEGNLPEPPPAYTPNPQTEQRERVSAAPPVDRVNQRPQVPPVNLTTIHQRSAQVSAALGAPYSEPVLHGYAYRMDRPPPWARGEPAQNDEMRHQHTSQHNPIGNRSLVLGNPRFADRERDGHTL